MGVLTGELHKLVFGGSLATTEQWACSIHMMTQGAETANDSLWIELMQAPIKAWFERVGSGINGSARLEFIKLNRINKGPVGLNLPGGHYADPAASNTRFLSPAGLPHAQCGNAPPQLSQVVSFTTDILRGRASKGRIFPPTTVMIANSDIVGSNGQVFPAETTLMANSAQVLLAELNNATTNLTAAVWSNIGQVGRAIETVRVGRVVDTQRRRRANVSEDYIAASAPV